MLTLSAVEHENSVASTIYDLSVIDWHTTRTRSFLSFAHMLLLPVDSPISGLKSAELVASVKSNIVTNSKLMRMLGPYWAVAEQVVSAYRDLSC